MDFGLDQAAVLDVEQLVADRRLGAGSASRLFKALTGDLPGNRDLPLWEAAHVLAACLITSPDDRGRPRDRIIERVLDRRGAQASHFAERYAGERTRTRFRARGQVGVLTLSGPDLQWESAWSRVADAFALLDAFATSDDLERCGSLSAIVEDLDRDLEMGIEAIRAAARGLGRIAHDWRQRHMSDVEFDRRSTALLRFLADAGRQSGSGRVADDDLLEFWSTRVAEGDRLTFRTAVDMGRAVERVAFDRRGLRALQTASDVDALQSAAIGDVAIAEPSELAQALDRLPVRPKFLTGAERAVLARAFSLAPWHVSHPVSVLRAGLFGDAQALLIEAERRRAATAPLEAISASGTYADRLGEWRDLGDHLSKLLRIAVTLARPDGLPPEEVERGAKILRAMRRAGFDMPREDLREAFHETESDLFMVEAGAAKHLAALDGLDQRRRLAEREDADRVVFAEGFSRLYGDQDVKR